SASERLIYVVRCGKSRSRVSPRLDKAVASRRYTPNHGQQALLASTGDTSLNSVYDYPSSWWCLAAGPAPVQHSGAPPEASLCAKITSRIPIPDWSRDDGPIALLQHRSFAGRPLGVNTSRRHPG
ncbi:MAG: hypothetical protein KDB00_24995, partial [Planctomycetales bacterium]|nr:hypothetical protein [Planctomycetales bacterium]